MRICFLVSFLLLIYTFSSAQDELKFGDTGATNTSPTYKPKDKDYKKQRLIQWIKKDSQGLLYGNKCMQEVTTAMGFEYVLQPKGRVGYYNGFERSVHNFFAKIGILLKNGPFWKFKLKKKRKECRSQTGDYMG